MEPSARIYVAGHRGLAGSALMRRLQHAGYGNLIGRTHAELELTDQAAVRKFFEKERPEYVFLAAARVGGILANNDYPAEFIQSNLAVQTNLIHEAWRNGVKRLLFLGSSCIYPRDCPQPIKEEYLLTGPLEFTNRAYAVAKIAGVEMCRSYNRQYGVRFLAAMPTNLYGPGDNFDLTSSHVLPALIRKFDDAREEGRDEVVIWGTGTPRREFLHVDDLADACAFLMEWYDEDSHINVGTGVDLTIRELAELVASVVHPQARLVFDTAKPDGTPRKQLDVTRLHALGWRHRIDLPEGIRTAYAWFLDHAADARGTQHVVVARA